MFNNAPLIIKKLEKLKKFHKKETKQDIDLVIKMVECFSGINFGMHSNGRIYTQKECAQFLEDIKEQSK